MALAARAALVRDTDGEQARPRDDHLRERAVAVADDRVGDDRRRIAAIGVDERGGDERADETRRDDHGGERTARPLGHEDGGQQRHAGSGERRQRGRKREPVDQRPRHGAACFVPTATGVCPGGSERLLTAAGQTDSASRQPTRGTMIASSAGRRSSAASVTALPRST